MTSDASASRKPIRLAASLILAFGFGIAIPGQASLAGVDGASSARADVAADSTATGTIVLAQREGWSGQTQRGGNWNKGGDWNKGGNKNNKNLSGKKNYNKNYNKNYSKNYNKHWGKGWSNYNNNWNKNWNRRAYVRNWYRKPYYGEFVGGILLGSLLATGGVVPYAPQPYLCWYWADPYMQQGYWDYC
jgi:hypothetical protein